eukprot:1183189-Prorocentrum_minimum.AAC.7
MSKSKGEKISVGGPTKHAGQLWPAARPRSVGLRRRTVSHKVAQRSQGSQGGVNTEVTDVRDVAFASKLRGGCPRADVGVLPRQGLPPHESRAGRGQVPIL